VRATREADFETLLAQSAKRIKALMNDGVTSIEIKSGYGLNLETERKMLQVARALGEEFNIEVYTTFLGAHTMAPEFTDKDEYIDDVIHHMLPTLASEGLVDAVDVFCEHIAFTASQSERVLEKAQSLNLPVKMHTEQLSLMDGAHLAAKHKALSADHLEYAREAEVKALANSGTVAVLLPGAFFALRETQKPPIDLFRQYQVPIAIASDCNPGSSPYASLQLMLNFACQQWRLTPAEALSAVTKNAAKALGIDDRVGDLSLGKQADLIVWDIEHPSQIAAEFSTQRIDKVMKLGSFR